jgi:hypothetical protein
MGDAESTNLAKIPCCAQYRCVCVLVRYHSPLPQFLSSIHKVQEFIPKIGLGAGPYVILCCPRQMRAPACGSAWAEGHWGRAAAACHGATVLYRCWSQHGVYNRPGLLYWLHRETPIDGQELFHIWFDKVQVARLHSLFRRQMQRKIIVEFQPVDSPTVLNLLELSA